ncbi:MAG: rRNA pseudouridine synthase [Agathobacter sp.]|nr:rRNA pseudouridine synthase [Agathobacter sp.]
MVRLDKFLADAGFGTRSEIKKLIRGGKVTVAGETAGQPERKIDPAAACVCVCGAPVEYQESVSYLFHKPAGCVTARTDATTPTVMDYFPAPERGKLSPVGRLDKDTEGLLIVTSDGALNHHLTSPARHVEKTYYAVLDHEVSEEAARQFAVGLDIGDDKPTKPAKLLILPKEEPFDAALPAELSGEAKAHARLTITEGRYHQVKRMFAAVDCRVLYLKRLSIGQISLGDLPRGEYRRLTEEELEALKA